ncbi:DUF4936 family protein [Niveibacterium sp.]|uniref:DUF4936 family protein n=1 Tax=Niveibacterium sp. TaxID=2017444 RepID=UPI0035B0F458
MSHLYIYYRIRPGTHETASVLAHAMLASLAQYAGHGRLMRRADDAETWMEVYEDVRSAPALLAAREHAVSSSGFAELIVGGAMHVEHFLPLEAQACA